MWLAKSQKDFTQDNKSKILTFLRLLKTQIKKIITFLIFVPPFCLILCIIFIIKRSKKIRIVAFDCADLGLYEHIDHYIKIVKAMKNCHVLVLTHKVNLEDVKALSGRSRVLEVSFAPYLFFVDLCITPHVHTSLPSSVYIVHVSHNQPIKYPSYPSKNIENIDEHFVWGELMMRFYHKMQEKHPFKFKQKLSMIGNPRIDHELKGCKRSESPVTVIGYAPSWDEGLSLRQLGALIPRELSLIPDLEVHVRLHPVLLTKPGHPDYYFYTGGVDWLKEITSIPKIKNIDRLSGYGFLKEIDILVTDVSSFSFDAFLLDKPVIFFHTEQFWSHDSFSTYKNFGYAGYEGNPQDDLLINGGRFAGIVVNNISELIEAISIYKKFPGYKGVERCELRQALLYNRGYSGDVAKHRLIELLDYNSNIIL